MHGLRGFTDASSAPHQVRRTFGKDDYFEAVGSYSQSPLTLCQHADNPNGALTTRVVGTYHRPTLLHGWHDAQALDRAGKLGAAAGTFVVAALNAVDLASDIAVAVELVESGHPRWGIASAAICLFSILLSVAVLLFERRYATT